MGARIRSYNWVATPLGVPETWPQSLRTAVHIMLTSRFAMWMAWGPELTFFCNDAYLPTTGIKRDWVLGARSDEVWAEIWPEIGPRIHRVLATGEATWDEALLLYLERSGFPEETYHTFSYSPLNNDAGTTIGMLCVVAEVTERVIGERQLAALRDLGTRLAGATTRAQTMQALERCLAAEPRDLPFALTYFYDADARRAALAARHGIGADARGAVAVVDLAATTSPWAFQQVLEQGEVAVEVGPEMIGSLPGQYWQSAPSRAVVVPIPSTDEGAPLGFLVAGLNPHRALDANYRGFIDLIAGQIAAAVARADEYERERARAETLAEIDRAKTAFFSNVSHEFRTPLTLMLGPLEDALADPGLPAEQADRVATAHRNGLRLLRLVNGLLDFSRIEAGRVVASYEPTDLAAYTADIASTFRSACERAGLSLTVDCPPLAAPVFIDRDMWEKVVLNLLSNAFKFTFDGSITVRLRAAEAMAELSVVDTGTGIPESQLPALFERFHRVEGARGRSFEGSGIGLALVHDLVHLHGGDVSVESAEGEGSTFRVRVPLGRAHLPPDRVRDAPTAVGAAGLRAHAFVDEALRWLPAAQAITPTSDVIRDIGHDGLTLTVGAAAAARRRAGRVLLADDNADLREYVSRLLETRGYAVTAVADGHSALASIHANRPDLVLTDVMMPGLDGFALLAAIRADPVLNDLPVVMLSARAGEEARIEGLDAGADDYLAKPFSARELLARVAANLDMARTRLEAAEALRASEARLRGVLEGMGDGFTLLDPAFRILDMNAEALRLESRPRDAVVGRVVWDAYPGFEGTEVGQLLRRAMDERVAVSLEHRFEWPDGHGVWLDMRAYPTEEGGLAIFFRDITDRRRAEDKLRDLNETLERRVVEAVSAREAALAQLHEAQKLETLGQLTGGVAHDFNNLLTPIINALHLLGRWHADERDQRMTSAALQSAERAKALVQRLLAFARRQALEPRPVDPAALIAGVRDLIAYSLGPTIRIEIAVPPDLPPALVDPNQLELALLNLAVNARDAMEDGGTLTIAARAEEIGPGSSIELAPGAYVRFEVHDTGSGMDEATLARAVEPFFSTKGIGKGTGLGLSMVHGLAMQSGGNFRLTSVLGKGTTATLWLPVTREKSTGLAGIGDPAERPAAGTGTLLLVDDEPLVRSSTAGMLRDAGYEVAEAGSAAEALDLVRNGLVPDVVVTDNMMPGMTGVQLITELRATLPTVPVLIVTGYARGDTAETPGLNVLGKPFAFSELATRITELMAPDEALAG